MSFVLPVVPTVDQVGVEERAAAFSKRSIKRHAKRQALSLIIRMMDLTTLEGRDTPGKVRTLCQKAMRPMDDQDIPSVAAVCVYPSLISIAKESLAGSTVRVASVATGFPSGQTLLDTRLEEVRGAVDDGADEIDMVVNRRALLSGDYRLVYDEIARTKEACRSAHLKVILETGELESYDLIAKASHIAMNAGADFIKTSTGKVQPAATLPVSLVMLQAIRRYYQETGRRVGFKPAGGIRSAKPAWQYLVMVKETLGDAWLTPDLLRFGASSLLNDVLMQWDRLDSGAYQSSVYYGLD